MAAPQAADGASADTDTFVDCGTVEEAMTREAIGVAADVSVKKTADVMRQHGIHRVLVMEGNHLKGVVSALDVARAVCETGMIGFTGRVLGNCAPDRHCGEGVGTRVSQVDDGLVVTA
jgi:predicted transcriptional regulator